MLLGYLLNCGSPGSSLKATVDGRFIDVDLLPTLLASIASSPSPSIIIAKRGSVLQQAICSYEAVTIIAFSLFFSSCSCPLLLCY